MKTDGKVASLLDYNDQVISPFTSFIEYSAPTSLCGALTVVLHDPPFVAYEFGCYGSLMQ